MSPWRIGTIPWMSSALHESPTIHPRGIHFALPDECETVVHGIVSDRVVEDNGNLWRGTKCLSSASHVSLTIMAG
jgi:hypothetical protein